MEDPVEIAAIHVLWNATACSVGVVCLARRIQMLSDVLDARGNVFRCIQSQASLFLCHCCVGSNISDHCCAGWFILK